jgi:hypothetical protein
MFQEHFLNKDAAERMGEENDFAMIPDVVLLEAGEEDFGQLGAGHFAVFVRGGVLGNFYVGKGEARVGADHVRPVGVVRGAPGFAAAVKAVDKNYDSCVWSFRGGALLDGDLGDGCRGVEQEGEQDQEKHGLDAEPDFFIH